MSRLPNARERGTELALRSEISRGLISGEALTHMSERLQVPIYRVQEIVQQLSLEWEKTVPEEVDHWRRRLLLELEDLKNELYKRYTGFYDDSDEGRLVQKTEVEAQGGKNPGITTTEVRKPTSLELSALQEIRAIIADERKILGIDAPAQVRSIHLNITPEDLKNLPEEELDRLIDELHIALPDQQRKVIDVDDD